MATNNAINANQTLSTTSTPTFAGENLTDRILATAISAPSTPSSGIGAIYVDSTTKNISVKDDAGVIKHGVQTKTVTSNQFLTAISDAGVVSAAQPSFSNISDYATNTWTPTIGDGTNNFTSSLSGAYLLIGKSYFIRVYGTWSSKGSASGNIRVSLPPGVTSKAAAGQRFPGSCGAIVGVNYTQGSDGTLITCSVDNNVTYFWLLSIQSDGGGTAIITAANCATSGEIQCAFRVEID